MGFYPAWKYAQVWELVLEDGRVTGEFDRSAEIKAQREHLAALPLKPAYGSRRDEVEAWIGSCFSREYKR